MTGYIVNLPEAPSRPGMSKSVALHRAMCALVQGGDQAQRASTPSLVLPRAHSLRSEFPSQNNKSRQGDARSTALK